MRFTLRSARRQRADLLHERHSVGRDQNSATLPLGCLDRGSDAAGLGHVELADVAERVGYGSASTFSTAFSRHVGRPPGRYAREGWERETV